MKKLFATLGALIEKMESAPTSFSLWFATFFALICFRLLIENWLGAFSRHSPAFLFSEFTHTFLFFLLSYLLFLGLLSFAVKTPIEKVSTVLLWGFVIILTPPIIDFIISKGLGFWSFYIFDGLPNLWLRFLTFFGNNPEIGITYGVRIEVGISLAFFFLYICLKTKKLLSGVIWTFFAYGLFFFLGTLPSWITFAVEGFSKNIFSISDTDIAQLFLAPEAILSRNPGEMLNVLNVKMSIIFGFLLALGIPLFGLFFARRKTIALARNIRLPQSIYHIGLVFVGAGLSMLLSHRSLHFSFFDILAFITLLIAVIFAWFASVIVNDIFDQSIDAITNRQRPLIKAIFTQKEYVILGCVFFLASLLLGAIAFPFSVGLLITYQSLAFLYSSYPFRLKRFPIAATFISAVASIVILLIGYIALHPAESLSDLPQNILLFLLFAYTVCLPIKDFKDIAGDKKDGVRTIPVLLGETRGRFLVACGIFLSFVLSVWVMNVPSILFWAIFFGCIAFWITATSNRWKKYSLSARMLPLALLVPVILYGLILVSEILKSFRN